MYIRQRARYLFILLILRNISDVTCRRKHRHDNEQQLLDNNLALRSPHVTLDAYGNCHTDDFQVSGRCTRYHDCPTAVRSWMERHIQPFTCYYTAYDNFVCCPPNVQQQQNSLPLVPLLIQITSRIFGSTPSRGVAPNAPYSSLPHQSPMLAPLAPLIQSGLQESKSERACSAFYTPLARFRRTSAPTEIVSKLAHARLEAVGGIRSQDNEFPFMCALGWKSTLAATPNSFAYYCGCVLIAERFILTAAHCAAPRGVSPSVVRIGGTNLNERNVEMIEINEIIIHPSYNEELAYNDIAIIKLQTSSRAKPVCLWNFETLPQRRLTALGYGQTQFGGPSSATLLKVFVDVVTNQNCSKYYNAINELAYGIDPGQICAGDEKGIMDTCQGDSGGPLLMEVSKSIAKIPYVVGLTSLGEGCATGVPSIYTRISHYVHWIEKIVF